MKGRSKRSMAERNQSACENLEHRNHRHSEELETCDEESDCASDDEAHLDGSEEDDPSFEIAEEEDLFRLAKLSIRKQRTVSSAHLCDSTSDEEKSSIVEVSVPPLDVKEEERFKKIQKIINEGAIEKLKVDECKIYLRKYGLRLTGKKDMLIARIKEHLEVKDGGGEKLYPQSSFVLNCKGDACAGDVVLFEQNVYDMYSIVSRSATAPPCGTRLVAGRIVKESYGAAKQQHTFTIEVLWSKGTKPLLPLHPLLIKGRNLYRLKTMRQRWPDEMERRKILREKHTRGSHARFSREIRVQKKVMSKKIAAENRKMNQDIPRQQENFPPPVLSTTGQVPTASNPILQPRDNQHTPLLIHEGNVQNIPHNVSHQILSQPPADYLYTQYVLVNSHFHHPTSQPNFHTASMHHINAPMTYIAQHAKPPANQRTQVPSNHYHRPFSGNSDRVRQPLRNLNFSFPLQRQQIKKEQVCRHFVRGSCFYGDSCKFIHDRK